MTKLFIAIVVVLAWEGQSVADVVGLTSNVLKRVVRVVVGASSGTAFTIDVDDRQYLITAKHVVAALKEGNASIQVCGDGEQCKESLVTILHCPDPIDIAVLVPRELLTVTFSLPADSSDMVLGQDVYFVGYPYADPALNTITPALENIGFVRKAVWSAQQRQNNATIMYFDGRNNVGFSGSPIVFLQRGKPGYDFKVAGVVSGFRSDFTETFTAKPVVESEITDEDRSANRILRITDGTLVRKIPTGQYVEGNTGIVIGYDIEHAVTLIRNGNTKGPRIKNEHAK